MDFIASVIAALGFSSPTFRDGFWPNFWSTVLAGTLLSGLISWLIAKARRPKLDVSLEFGVSTGGRYTLMFAVINRGKISFSEREIHWQIYFDECLNIESPPSDWTQVGLNGKSFWCFKGAVELPCFAGSFTYFFEIPVIGNNVAVLDLNYYYSLSTVRGFFPRQSIVSRLLGRQEVAPGGNQFVRMPLGEIKLKAF